MLRLLGAGFFLLLLRVCQSFPQSLSLSPTISLLRLLFLTQSSSTLLFVTQASKHTPSPKSMPSALKYAPKTKQTNIDASQSTKSDQKQTHQTQFFSYTPKKKTAERKMCFISSIAISFVHSHKSATQFPPPPPTHRTITRLNSKHHTNSYAVLCFKKKKNIS